jgi:hypothetical protein
MSPVMGARSKAAEAIDPPMRGSVVPMWATGPTQMRGPASPSGRTGQPRRYHFTSIATDGFAAS